ncbi:MAG: serine/threonine-protein kinase [Hyphomonadaceae bacterium]
MKCPHCSVAVPEDARFCPECGKRITGAMADASASMSMQSGPVLTFGGLQTMDGPSSRASSTGSTEALLEPGDLFADRYEIKAVIGAGGAGVVYAARDKVTSEDVALKLIRPDRLHGSDAVSRLVREGVTARGVRHPNVIAVYDVGEADGQPYMSMELAQGQSLRSWNQKRLAARRDCSLKTAAVIVSAILDGLEAAHAKGIVHRDLKPENVILTSEPSDEGVTLKILDFGIAIAVGATTGISGSGPAGSIGYMAPEQLTAPDTVGPSADLYSVSVIFYELLMDAPPQGHWQPPSGGRSGISAGIDSLIENSLSNRARSRPQSVADYRKAMKAALGPMGMVDWKTLYQPRRSKLPTNIPKWVWWTAGIIIGLSVIAYLMDEYSGASGGDYDQYGSVTPATAVGTAPEGAVKQTAVTVPSQRPAPSRLSGSWDDGAGSIWRVNVTDGGQVTGQATSGAATGMVMTGAFAGDQFSFQSGVNGYGATVQGQGLFDGGCHINFQSYDAGTGLTSAGQIHVNHPAGAPCP